MSEIANRITHYITGANSVVQLPVAEAMVTYKEKSTDEESSQIFVPFIIEVRIGPIDTTVSSTSVDLDDAALSTQSSLSSSPPQSGFIEKTKDNHTPPSSPNVNHPTPGMNQSSSSAGMVMSPSATSMSPELLDLQLDYWTTTMRPEISDKERMIKKDSKASLKTTFKCVQVSRLPPLQGPWELASSALTLMVVTKEKKQKIMRLGKKSKELESKSQMVDGISRLVCTSKSQSHPFTVSIDGSELMGVKFFQLSCQWQTHVKHIPVLMFCSAEPLS